MKASIIQLGVKYQLCSTETNSLLLEIYNNCLREICYHVSMNKPLSDASNEYIHHFSNNLGTLKGYINDYIRMLKNNSNLIIPNLTDDSKSLNFEVFDIKFEIDKEEFLKRNLVINLTLISKKITLIGTVSDKLIIALGDNSEKLQSKQEIKDLFFLTLKPEIIINSYQEI